MAYCPICGAEVDTASKFCQSCGTELEKDSGANNRDDESSATSASDSAGGLSRRHALLVGGAGVSLLGLGGGATVGGWLLYSLLDSGTVIDFEDGIDDAWRGDLEVFETTSDPERSGQVARLAFGGASDVWRPMENGQPSEISLFWKTEAVDDNEFTVWFYETAATDPASVDNPVFGVEVGAENRGHVVTAPPFNNRTTFDIVSETIEPNTWYQVMFSNLDFDAGTFDLSITNTDGTTIGSVTGVEMAGDPDSIEAIGIRNHMNHSGAAAFIDEIVIE